MENKLYHDLNNYLERLKIMQEMIKREDFSNISKDEILQDMDQTLKDISKIFHSLLQ